MKNGCIDAIVSLPKRNFTAKILMVQSTGLLAKFEFYGRPKLAKCLLIYL